MKVFGIIMKIVAALAVVAGIVYVVATYGDKIVAWARKLLDRCKCCCGGECTCDGECCCDEECVCEEVAEQEAPVEEAQASDSDFEG